MAHTKLGPMLFLVAILVGAIFLCVTPGQTVAVEYKVSFTGSALTVAATLDAVPKSPLYLVFAVDGWGKQGLDRRITNLSAHTVDGKRLDTVLAKPGVYRINNDTQNTVLVQYTLQPELRGYDHHLTTVTREHVQLPVRYTFFEVRVGSWSAASVNTKANLSFANLPASWRVLTNCPVQNDGSIAIQNGNDLIFAGNYAVRQVNIHGTEFTVALNHELATYAEVMNRLDEVLQMQYHMFGRYVRRDALVVANPLPAYAGSITFGGQALPGLAVLYTQPGGAGAEPPARFLSHLAHETFHLWLAQSFALAEGMYWFTEGFAQYHEYQVLQSLHLVDEKELYSLLANDYVVAARAEKLAGVSLRQAGAYLFTNPEHRAMSYNKGALVAYLFDRELQQWGGPKQNLNAFYHYLYTTYATTGKPMTNEDVILAMNNFLENPQFTQRWVLERTPFTAADIPVLKPYLRSAWLAALPDIVVEWLNPTSPYVLTIVLLAVVLGLFVSMRPKQRS